VILQAFHANRVKTIVQQLTIIIRLTGSVKYKCTDIPIIRIVNIIDIRTDHTTNALLTGK